MGDNGQNGHEPLGDRILAMADISVEQVPVPEWDGLLGPNVPTVLEVRSMSALEKTEAQAAFADAKTGVVDNTRFYPALVVASTYDPDTGERVFRPGSEKQLNAKNSRAVTRLAEAALRLNGMTAEQAEQAGEASAEVIGSGSSTS